MAKTITISMTDSEFETLKSVYSSGDLVADKAYIKAKLVNILKSAVRKYDEKNTSVSYSSFDPS